MIGAAARPLRRDGCDASAGAPLRGCRVRRRRLGRLVPALGRAASSELGLRGDGVGSRRPWARAPPADPGRPGAQSRSISSLRGFAAGRRPAPRAEDRPAAHSGCGPVRRAASSSAGMMLAVGARSSAAVFRRLGAMERQSAVLRRVRRVRREVRPSARPARRASEPSSPPRTPPRRSRPRRSGTASAWAAASARSRRARLRVLSLAEQRLLHRGRRDARRRVREHRRLRRRLVARRAAAPASPSRRGSARARLAAVGEAVEAHAHAGRDRRTARIVLARPHDGAFTRDQRRRIAQLELELHLRTDGERLLRADEDAALTDVDRVALDELLERLALELDLERDRRALPLSGIWIGQGVLPACVPSISPVQDTDLLDSMTRLRDATRPGLCMSATMSSPDPPCPRRQPRRNRCPRDAHL